MKKKIKIIGGGLAGTNAAYFLANKGIEVDLYDQKPTLVGPFHSTKFAELVCSNSLKSEARDNACGLLKDEIACFNSLFTQASKFAKIPSGMDLAVDREKFSSFIDEKIRSHPNIHVFSEKVEKIVDDELTIICTGPLSDEKFLSEIDRLTSIKCSSFYDAAAPLVYFDSLDTSKMYYKNRYDKGEGKYLNIPLTEEEYYKFTEELVNAKRVELHDFEHFEGCLPIEVMALRGKDTLRFGPLTPKGLYYENIKPFAVVQLRKDDASGQLYGLVGFQTNLTYPEQRRVLCLLPGMNNVKFARYGLMHRNSYLIAPSCLNRNLSLKGHENIFIGGQFSGVEGYVESAGSGLLAAIYAYLKLENKEVNYIPLTTMLGSLVNYLVMSSSKHFAPINACYGILQNYNKKEKMKAYETSISDLKDWIDKLGLLNE